MRSLSIAYVADVRRGRSAGCPLASTSCGRVGEAIVAAPFFAVGGRRDRTSAVVSGSSSLATHRTGPDPISSRSRSLISSFVRSFVPFPPLCAHWISSPRQVCSVRHSRSLGSVMRVSKHEPIPVHRISTTLTKVARMQELAPRQWTRIRWDGLSHSLVSRKAASAHDDSVAHTTLSQFSSWRFRQSKHSYVSAIGTCVAFMCPAATASATEYRVRKGSERSDTRHPLERISNSDGDGEGCRVAWESTSIGTGPSSTSSSSLIV
mmetsp:Transcript_7732/g.19092  ORF Transcript_7732/g.19092 Transcript_7732/m.19092 type:complete len:264 (+) Transcript_7732:74-865(+)